MGGSVELNLRLAISRVRFVSGIYQDLHKTPFLSFDTSSVSIFTIQSKLAGSDTCILVGGQHRSCRRDTPQAARLGEAPPLCY
jgi:hypothetical protein